MDDAGHVAGTGGDVFWRHVADDSCNCRYDRPTDRVGG